MTAAARLLTAVADALNAADEAGLPITNLHAGIVWTDAGYVLPFGDDRPGCRWMVRERTEHPSGEGQASAS
jgi:hypothetical protein